MSEPRDVGEPGELTRLLHRAQRGDRQAADALFAETYPVLQRLARARLRGHARTPTLDTGSLVNEAYLRFVSAGRLQIEDRVHFRRWVGRAMRSVIVDLARRRQAERRGGRLARVTLTSDLPVEARAGEDLILRVHEALDAFAAADARAAHVVELRFFAGMTESEVAAALEVTERTVRRDWEKARLLLGEMLR
jgi:RNA polymerase sigma factor (TIGR02999 family)